MIDEIILVDQRDNDIGSEEKDACHRIPTKLHRAFSIFIVNQHGNMLIQKRAATKKTWPGFWSNACCSHPKKGENISDSTQRRLSEELGFTCPLQHISSFHYKADYDKEFGENEIDHVFVGQFDGVIKSNKDEIEDWRFVSIEELSDDVHKHPQKFTPWFKKALPKVVKFVTSRLQEVAKTKNQHTHR
ncbi:MAG: isopentenyl-diphosphate Delta-isomerase [Syntrophorhabdus sp.]